MKQTINGSGTINWILIFTAIFFSNLTFAQSSNSSASSISTPNTSVQNDELKIKAFGDMRLRHETLQKDGTDDRNRQRMRLRAGVKASVSNDIDVGFRVATGGSSITSANQDLGQSFSKKSFGIDRAYIAYEISETLNFVGGKMKMPFYRSLKSELIWDSDVNPEGIALFHSKNLGSDSKISTRTGAFVLEERRTDNNAMLFAGQIEYSSKISSSNKIKSGVSFYGFTDVKGYAPLFGSDGNGNTLVGDGSENNPFLISRDYQVGEVFSTFESKVFGKKVALGFNGLMNFAVADKNLGSTVGLKFGSKNDSIPITFGYKFHYIERDATLAVITGSDALDGDTNGLSHEVFGEYYLSKRSSLAADIFVSSLEIDKNRASFVRAMADFKVAF